MLNLFVIAESRDRCQNSVLSVDARWWDKRGKKGGFLKMDCEISLKNNLPALFFAKNSGQVGEATKAVRQP